MILEEDANDRLYFSNAVKEFDATNESLEVRNGAQALKPLHKAQQQLDFILIDINMPLMNKLDYWGKLKKAEKRKNIPLIIYSSTQYQKNSGHTSELNASYFLNKPIIIKQIVQLPTNNFIKGNAKQ